MTRVREFSTRGEPDKTFENLHELLTSVCKAAGEDFTIPGFRLNWRLEERKTTGSSPTGFKSPSALVKSPPQFESEP